MTGREEIDLKLGHQCILAAQWIDEAVSLFPVAPGTAEVVQWTLLSVETFARTGTGRITIILLFQWYAA